MSSEAISALTMAGIAFYIIVSAIFLGFLACFGWGLAKILIDRIKRKREAKSKPKTCTMEEDIWIPCEEDGCTRLSTPRWWCSECEDDSIGSRPNYCPNCGAKVVR